MRVTHAFIVKIQNVKNAKNMFFPIKQKKNVQNVKNDNRIVTIFYSSLDLKVLKAVVLYNALLY